MTAKKPFDFSTVCVGPGCPIRGAVARMDRTREGIVLVVDGERRLLGTVTDGDMRRALLARIDLDGPISVLLARKEGTPLARPLSAPATASRDACRKLLKEHKLLHLPLLDKEQRVVGLVFLNELVPDHALGLRAVVMAGGKGSRLLPLTKDTPKPMLDVGDQPLMEIILEQLRDAGIKQVHVSTHHHKDKIVEYFGDGKELGLDLNYLDEDRPLGTAGALGLMAPSDETILVINGDILTQMDFRAMHAYHKELGADLTVAVSQYDIKVPYGVIECDGSFVRAITEKPTLEFFVGAGIYLLEPAMTRYIPKGQRSDMTDLIASRSAVVTAQLPDREYWLDTGQHGDYKKARRPVKAWQDAGPDAARPKPR